MRGRRDDDVRLRRLFVGKRCRCGVRRSPRSCKMILLILPCPIWRWRRRMVMLDTKLYLVSVVWFLRRSCVDCGTGGSKVVVGSDSSKQKVVMARYFVGSTMIPACPWFPLPRAKGMLAAMQLRWVVFWVPWDLDPSVVCGFYPQFLSAVHLWFRLKIPSLMLMNALASAFSFC